MCNNTTKIVPFSEVNNSNLDLNLVVKQARKMTSILSQMGIEEATFKSGAYFRDDSNTQTLVAEGILVQKSTDLTIVAFSNNGSSREEVIKAVSEKIATTQKERGAFVGRSQPWISDKESED